MNTYRRPACVGRRYDLDQVSFLSKTRSSGVTESCINLTKAFQMIIFVALAMVGDFDPSLASSRPAWPFLLRRSMATYVLTVRRAE